jgi:hypothetical protein
MATGEERRKSGLVADAKSFEIHAISASSLGQSYPQHYPQFQDTNAMMTDRGDVSPLGAPLSIREVARLIGCSAWTVRQRHLPQGLPCFRSGPTGKLIFYRNQVVAWILRQQKGGK